MQRSISSAALQCKWSPRRTHSLLLTLSLAAFTHLCLWVTGAAAGQDREIAVSCKQGRLWVIKDVTVNNGCILPLACCVMDFHGSNAALSYLKYFRVFVLWVFFFSAL